MRWERGRPGLTKNLEAWEPEYGAKNAGCFQAMEMFARQEEVGAG